jgi:hypothetical protein
MVGGKTQAWRRPSAAAPHVFSGDRHLCLGTDLSTANEQERIGKVKRHKRRQ